MRLITSYLLKKCKNSNFFQKILEFFKMKENFYTKLSNIKSSFEKDILK